MTVAELIKELSAYPQDIEVFIDAESREATFDKPVTSADWCSAGQRAWVVITDYPNG